MKPIHNPTHPSKSLSTFGSALALSLLMGTAHAAPVAIVWDIDNVETPTASAPGGVIVSELATVSPAYHSSDSSNGGWRTRGYSGSDDYVQFSLTTDPSTTLTLESLVFEAWARAANSSGGAWVAPELILEYATDAAFTTPVAAGTLDLGADVPEGGGHSTKFTSDTATFFSTDLVINPSETYYFRLRASDATGSNTGRNQIYYDNATDLTLNADLVSTSTELIWTGSTDGDWNLTDTNWEELSSPGVPVLFSANDDVTIDTADTLTVDGAGITAGSTSVTAAGDVTFTGGNLTTSTLSKSGAGTLLVQNSIDTGSAITSLTNGIIQIETGGSMTTSGLSLTGGSSTELVINDTTPGAFTNTGDTELGATGGRLRVNTGASLSLSNVTASAEGASLDKRGDGSLTVTGPAGSDANSLDLHLQAGSLNFVGGNDVHITNASDPNSVNGPISLDATQLHVHGVNFQGSGSIESLNSASRIRGDFNAGHNTIAVPVTLTADLTAEARPNGSNGSSVTFDAIVSGPGNLITDGPGDVILAADNTYLGTTTVMDGSLVVGGGLESTTGTLGAGNVTVEADGLLEFSRNDAHIVAHTISGAGGVVINNGLAGSTTLTGSNDYTGVTRIDGGTLIAPTLDDGEFPSSIGASTDDVSNLVLRGQGVLSYTGPAILTGRGFSLGGAVNGSEFGGGAISADGSGPMTFDYDGPMGADGTGSTPRGLTLSGSVVGVNSIAADIGDGQNSQHFLVKEGTTTWLLTGDNTYTGDTTIQDGTLQLGPTTDLTDTSVVRINGATSVLQLTDGVTDVVEELWVDGVQMAAGLYGSSTSSAPLENQDDVHFSGTGTLSVTSGPAATDYETWAGESGYDLVEGPEGDDDGDGVSNEDEYAFGLDPTDASSVNPIAVQLDNTSGTFSYTRRDPAEGTNLVYTVWTSTDLDTWIEDEDAVQTPGATDGNGNQTVAVTLFEAPTAPSFFVRVIAAVEVPE